MYEVTMLTLGLDDIFCGGIFFNFFFLTLIKIQKHGGKRRASAPQGEACTL